MILGPYSQLQRTTDYPRHTGFSGVDCPLLLNFILFLFFSLSLGGNSFDFTVTLKVQPLCSLQLLPVVDVVGMFRFVLTFCVSRLFFFSGGAGGGVDGGGGGGVCVWGGGGGGCACVRACRCAYMCVCVRARAYVYVRACLCVCVSRIKSSKRGRINRQIPPIQFQSSHSKRRLLELPLD